MNKIICYAFSILTAIFFSYKKGRNSEKTKQKLENFEELKENVEIIKKTESADISINSNRLLKRQKNNK